MLLWQLSTDAADATTGALIPIGILGVFRWMMWLAKRIPALFYRPIENDYRHHRHDRHAGL